MGNVTNWRGWNITAETANGISNGDINARNRFYMDNLARIRKMAFGYARTRSACRWSVDDLISSVYIDMDVWTYSAGYPLISGGFISWLVYRSFAWALRGGFAYVVEQNVKLRCAPYLPPVDLSLDAPFNGKRVQHQDEANNALFYYIPAPDCFQTLENFSAVDCLAVVGEYLSPRERDFFGLLLDGFAPSVACEHLGIKQHGTLSKRIHCKLVKNYAVIVERLAILGVDLPSFAMTAPADLAKALTALSSTPESRAKARENARLRRERQRAL